MNIAINWLACSISFALGFVLCALLGQNRIKE